MTNKAESLLTKIKENPKVSAAIFMAILALIFVSPSFFEGRLLAPVDTLHYDAPYLDITTQMLPWHKLSKEILANGGLPLWNIFSGNGLPLLANMQTASFFPLTWLFYIFDFRVALIFYGFIKIWLMGMLTFYFLREIKLGLIPSFAGMVMFAFCGANTIWFLWPLTNVILILPLGFLLIEKYFNTKQIKFALCLSPAIAMGILGGHPQTFFYVFLAIASYALYKICREPQSLSQRLKDSLIFLICTGLGVLMSAAVLLPFLEYLKISANLDYRAGFSENPFYLSKLLFLANLIPDFYGNTGIKNFSYLLVPNYGELALGYIGASGFFLSLLAFTKKNKKTVWFFLLGTAATFSLIYHLPIFYQIVNKLPGFSLNYNNRLLYISAFFLSVLASIGIDNLRFVQISAKRLSLTSYGFLIFSVGLIVVNRFSSSSWNFAHNLDWTTVSLWQIVLISAFGANLLLLYWAIKKRAYAALLLIITFETAIHGMIFTRTVKPANFYPATPVIKFLQSKQESEHLRVFPYGHNLLPNIGTWYGINQLNDHDTMYLRSNKLLKKNIANFNYSPEYTFDAPNLNALRFLSVGYLLYPPKEGREILQAHSEDLKTAFTGNDLMVLALNNPLPRAFFISASDKTDLTEKLKQLMQNPDLNSIIPVNNFVIQLDGTETFDYSAAADGYIVTTDNYYPDWRATLKDATIVTAEDAMGLRVFKINPDSGQMTINYHPTSFYLGLKISLGAILLWGGLILLAYRKVPRENS